MKGGASKMRFSISKFIIKGSDIYICSCSDIIYYKLPQY